MNDLELHAVVLILTDLKQNVNFFIGFMTFCLQISKQTIIFTALFYFTVNFMYAMFYILTVFNNMIV